MRSFFFVPRFPDPSSAAEFLLAATAFAGFRSRASSNVPTFRAVWTAQPGFRLRGAIAESAFRRQGINIGKRPRDASAASQGSLGNGCV